MRPPQCRLEAPSWRPEAPSLCPKRTQFYFAGRWLGAPLGCPKPPSRSVELVSILRDGGFGHQFKSCSKVTFLFKRCSNVVCILFKTCLNALFFQTRFGKVEVLLCWMAAWVAVLQSRTLLGRRPAEFYFAGRWLGAASCKVELCQGAARQSSALLDGGLGQRPAQ